MGTLANVVVEPCQVLWNGVDLGFTEGDLEITPEEQSVDVTAHQEGTNVLDSIRIGKSVEVSVTLKETTLAKLSALITAGGGSAGSVAAVTGITCVADVAGSLNNKYFQISSQSGVQYFVWFNVNSEGVSPALAGMTGVEVALATGATDAQVATAVASALDALAGFVAPAPAAEVVAVTNAAAGVTNAPAAGNSGFTIAVTTAGANEQVGWGSSKDFTSMLSDAKKLVFHPVAEGATTNQTKDVAFWKAYPLLGSIVYSGENPKLVSISFKIFPDSSKAAAVRLFAFGSHV